MGASQYSQHKGCEVLFGASRRCQAESTTQSPLEKVEQSSCHPLLHLLSLDCAGFFLWMSKHTDATAVPVLTSGGRLCTTRTPGLECTGVLLTSGGAGLWQPDFSGEVCLRIAWFLLKPFYSGSNYHCYSSLWILMLLQKNLLCGAFHPKSPYSDLPAWENDTNLYIWLILKVILRAVVGALLQLCPLKGGKQSPPWDNLCFVQQHSFLRTVGTTQLLLLDFLGPALFLV